MKSRDKALSQYAKAINLRQNKEKAFTDRVNYTFGIAFQISEKRMDSFTGSKQESFELSIKHAKEQIIDANKTFNATCLFRLKKLKKESI